MNNKVFVYKDRGDNLNIIDPGSLPHEDEPKPIMLIAGAVMKAGYKGVIVDQHLMSNGKYMHALNVDTSTPEGRIVGFLSRCAEEDLLEPEAVVTVIRRAYEIKGE